MSFEKFMKEVESTMQKINISILDALTLGDDIDFSLFRAIANVTVYGMTAPQTVTEHIGNSDVIIVNKVKLNQDNLKEAENLKLICVTATGYDNIDIEYCKSRQIAVCNVCGYSSESVSQVTVAMALSLVNNLPYFDDFVKSGQYTESGKQNRVEPVFHEVGTMTWGIVGLGAIGRKTAQTAKVLGFNVIAYKRTPDAEFECVSLDELCRRSDIISIHLPLTDSTRNIIDKEKIRSMKNTAIVINVARGAVVDEEALAEAVLNGDIGGIGIDVYTDEPMSADSPYNMLKSMKNVILTPHMAWGAYEARVRCMNEIAENIRCFYSGEIRNRVDV